MFNGTIGWNQELVTYGEIWVGRFENEGGSFEGKESRVREGFGSFENLRI